MSVSFFFTRKFSLSQAFSNDNRKINGKHHNTDSNTNYFLVQLVSVYFKRTLYSEKQVVKIIFLASQNLNLKKIRKILIQVVVFFPFSWNTLKVLIVATLTDVVGFLRDKISRSKLALRVISLSRNRTKESYCF